MSRLFCSLRTLLVLSPVLLTMPAAAQLSWPRSAEGASVKIEYLAPSYAQKSPGFEMTAYGISLSARIATGETSFFVAEIPYLSTKESLSGSYFGSPYSFSESKASVGNIYLGFDLADPEASTVWELGVRLPTLSKNDAFAGSGIVLGDINRMEIYIPTYLSLRGAFVYEPVLQNGAAFLLRFGPSVLIPTESSYADKTEFLLDYGAGVGFESETFRVGVGVVGRAILSEEHFLADKKALHHFEAGANMTFGSVRPGIFVRLPLDSELSKGLNHTLGVYVCVAL